MDFLGNYISRVEDQAVEAGNWFSRANQILGSEGPDGKKKLSSAKNTGKRLT